jgi:hypothetical protein
MRLYHLCSSLLFKGILCALLPGSAVPLLSPYKRDTGPGHPLAQVRSWVLFNSGRAQEGAPFFAYGYLSQIQDLPQARQQEDESSAVLTFVVEGTVVDLQQSGSAFMVESQGTLRIFFDPQATRNFTKPEGFRSGQETAVYNFKRYVFFDPPSGELYDRSFASLVSSHSFTFKGRTVDLLRLWGTQLIFQAQAHARDTLPSPLSEYTAAIPYTGTLFTGGERAEYVPQSPSFVRAVEM